MSSGWDHAQGMADKHSGSGSGLFVRLANNGDKIVGAFVGEPYAREVHWGGERYEECPAEGCGFCGEGKHPSLRVSMNLFVPADGDVKIIEGGVTWFKDLMKVRDKYGLGKWMFEIERHGEAGDPKTTYTILPEEQLTKAQLKELDGLRLHDLPKVVSGGEDGFDSYDKGSSKAIDSRTASELMPRLKALPRAALDTFLAELGIQRVRDLKASEEKKAQALLERLEAENKPEEEDTSIDPFA